MCLPLHLELFPDVKIAVSGERLGRALPSTLNSSINYFRPVSVKTIFFHTNARKSISIECSFPKVGSFSFETAPTEVSKLQNSKSLESPNNNSYLMRILDDNGLWKL